MVFLNTLYIVSLNNLTNNKKQ